MSELKKLLIFIQDTKLSSAKELYEGSSLIQFAFFSEKIKEARFKGCKTEVKLDVLRSHVTTCIASEREFCKLAYCLFYKATVYALVFWCARYCIVGSFSFSSIQDFSSVLMGAIFTGIGTNYFYRRLPQVWLFNRYKGRLTSDFEDFAGSYLLSRLTYKNSAVMEHMRLGLGYDIDSVFKEELREKCLRHDEEFKGAEAILPVYELVLGCVLGISILTAPLATALH